MTHELDCTAITPIAKVTAADLIKQTFYTLELELATHFTGIAYEVVKEEFKGQIHRPQSDKAF